MICQACKEEIKDGAVKCKYCGSSLNEKGQILNIEKQLQLFKIVKNETEYRQNALTRKDDKASKYMVLLTIVFALESFFAKWAIDTHLINSITYTVLLVFISLSVLAFAVTLFSFLNILKGVPIKMIKFDDKEMQIANESNFFDYLARLNDWMKTEFVQTKEQSVLKDKRLKLVHFMMNITLSLAIIVIIMSLIVFVRNNSPKGGDFKMADNNAPISAPVQNVVQTAPTTPVQAVEATPTVIAQPVNSDVHMFSENNEGKENR
ncbi:MAG: zinc ribbon domain-containing protein [Candidatus Goldbacteria bacterium]|nr:zinc ribbon domain-containing protein [Candidatus Goldiibacteriota bacterium]